MAQQGRQNNWQDFHKNLESNLAKKYKAEVGRVLNISQSAFYRKLKEPDRFLSIADKLAIARVYNLNPIKLFPELENENNNENANE